MWKEFKAFLIKQNMLALAIAVVIGAATNDVVQGLVNDFIMPVVNAASPTKDWQALRFPQSGPVQFTYGHFLSVLLKFVIVGFVCWRLTLALIKPAKPEEKPAADEPQTRPRNNAEAWRVTTTLMAGSRRAAPSAGCSARRRPARRPPCAGCRMPRRPRSRGCRRCGR